MEPEQKQEGTPRSIADAVQVLQSSQAAGPVPGVGLTPQEPVVRAVEVAPAKRDHFYKKKKFLIAAGAALAVAVLGVIILTIVRSKGTGGAHNNQQNGILGVSIITLDGKAASSSDGENWTELTRRSHLSQGDHIRTEGGTRMVLKFDNGSAVRLDESTTIRLASLKADTIQLEQKSGSMYSRVTSSSGTYAVTTDTAVYTAKGTAFQTINDAVTKGVRVLQSSVALNDISVHEGKQFFTVHPDNQYLEKITDIPLEDLKSDGFLLWNLEQDEKDDTFKQKLGYWKKLKQQQSDTETLPAGAKLTLTASNSHKGTELAWELSGMGAPDGFKIVRSQTSPIPLFGRDESQYSQSPSARAATWSSTKSGTFHYRVCVYRASDASCTLYSNTVTIESAHIPPEAVVPGAVELALSDNVVNWTFAGTAPHGFKVLVAASENPTYPKDAEYFGNAPYTLKSRGSGTYYIRVCKYTGSDEIDGGCTDYSNQVIWIIP